VIHYTSDGKVVLILDQLNEILTDIHAVVKKAEDYNIPGMVLLGMFQHISNQISVQVRETQDKAFKEE